MANPTDRPFTLGPMGNHGLPPGAPVPSWAVNKPVVFTPKKDLNTPSALTGSSGVSPLVAGLPGEKLQYHGGPVQHHPEVYLIFWGNNSEKETFELREFYGGLEKGEPAQHSWQDILTQYEDKSGRISEHATWAGQCNCGWGEKAPKKLGYTQMEDDISEAISHQSWHINDEAWNLGPEADIVFFVPTGTTYEGGFIGDSCGWHGVLESGYGAGHVYEFVPEAETIGGCIEGGNRFHSTTETASHEYAEATTDPLPGLEPGWTGGPLHEPNYNEEIGDLCNNGPKELPEKEGRKGYWFVTELWDDENHSKSKEGQCSLEDPPYPLPSAPSITAEAATGILSTTADLHDSVNPNGPETHYYFQYGETTAYGSLTSEADVGFGTTNKPVEATISGLRAGTTYHYRIVAKSWVGTTYGSDQTLTTESTTDTLLASNGEQWVYYRGTNGRLYAWYWNDHTWQLEWLGETGAVGSNVSAGRNISGEQWVYYRGTNGQLYAWYWNNHTWQLEWLGETGAMAGAPKAVFASNGEQEVFYRGTNGQLYFWAWNDHTWILEWLGETGAMGGEPAPVLASNGEQEIFYRGTNGQLYFWAWNDHTWILEWLGETGAMGGEPAPVLASNGEQEIFYGGREGKLFFWAWNDHTWILEWLGEAVRYEP